MSVQSAILVQGMTVAPEVRQALEAIELPEVRKMIKELAKYNLGVCVPHIHRPEVDFDTLPDDTVQVETNCRVDWVRRSELDTNSIPVAWRWASDSTVSDVECIQTCTPDEKRGHRRGHL